MGKFSEERISLLCPFGCTANFKTLSEVTIHDLGLDSICNQLSEEESERALILSILSKMTENPRITQYRCDIFGDIYNNAEMRNQILKTLDRINFLREYGSLHRENEEAAGIWDLLHRLDELKDYIQCVEAIFRCLSDVELCSEGLLNLKEYINELYHNNGFEELKKDISALKATTSDLKSVTVGINLNERFEANGIGLISVNNKYFTKSNIIGNLCDLISSKDSIKSDTEWKENYKYYPLAANDSKISGTIQHLSKASLTVARPKASVGMASVPEGDTTEDVTKYMDEIANHMISTIVKKLRSVLNKYVTLTITDITNLLPEFIYYIRWAEYIETLSNQGIHFGKALLASGNAEEHIMRARGIYNLKLASVVTKEHEVIVTNDLDFDQNHLVYILTGANRGGKTTITQAIGQLFVLAQGGIFVPGDSFEFHPVDCIYTHFPADEDKTMDLGRLGEECKRFRELYKESTKNSLLLLNETFSTTSFEEGYFIAKDSVKAILSKGVRTIYNTHMHKLACDIEELNDSESYGKASSLIVKADGGNRSYKVEIAPPEGMSYANDIAKKYGVTYEMLTDIK